MASGIGRPLHLMRVPIAGDAGLLHERPGRIDQDE